MNPRTIAVIGAECSGKSTLSDALAQALPAERVGEQLRFFVEREGRVPTQSEQLAVMHSQISAERAAAARASDWVVSDAGALMTAVYSKLYYADDSLLEAAVAHHRAGYALTLWCDIDLPWAADEGQRDGAAYRSRGHAIIAAVVRTNPFEVVRVAGTPQQRLRTALIAMTERGWRAP